MTTISRFLGTSLLIGSMATAAWAGETGGSGLPAPVLPPEASTPVSTSTTPLPVQDIPAPTADAMSALVSWLAEAIL